ncbi:glycoside hydrolase family 3 protein [Ktedonosporobacter rubrisoli]|nr:glycoside hydrolase family 3 N-terminal domain-containing protein [Ktedonosporobacter rubrisoli]
MAILVCCLLCLCTTGATPALSAPPHQKLPSGITPIAHKVVTPNADVQNMKKDDPQQKRLRAAQQIIQSMTFEQKLGQLIIVEYLGTDYADSGLQTMIQRQSVGGFMYQAANHNFDPPYDDVNKVKALSEQAVKDAQIPLLIATDQEGGLVNRLYTFHGELPSAQEMAASGDPQVAFAQGKQSAGWMRELGINADLAPVVDVQTVDPPVLASRMFGRDPQTVAKYAGAFLKGLQENEVAGCLKHFPGLGAITSDPHNDLPVVERSKAELENIDLAPYKLIFQQRQPAMVMATDVLMPTIDPDLPAELSPKAINGVLRGELGYNGVVITDGLYMEGISQKWTLGQAAVLSIQAGGDLIEGPFTVQQVAEAITALKQAVQQGKISTERIDQSVQRILLMKMQYHILSESEVS